MPQQRHTWEWGRVHVCRELAGPPFPWFRKRFPLVCDTYGNAVNDVVLIVAGSSVSSLIVHEDDSNFGDITLSRSTEVPASLRVDFTAIQMQCHE